MAKKKLLIPIGMSELLGMSSIPVTIKVDDTSFESKPQFMGIDLEEADVAEPTLVDMPETKMVLGIGEITQETDFEIFMRKYAKSRQEAFNKVVNEMNRKEMIQNSNNEYKAPTMRSNIKKGKRR